MTTATKKRPKQTKTPAAELLAFAKKRAKDCRTWHELHNAIYGIGGRFAELIPEGSARTEFAGSDEFRAIGELISDLRKKKAADDDTEPASGKFLIRLPESMHSALAAEAKREGVSLNQLCVAKLAIQLSAAVR